MKDRSYKQFRQYYDQYLKKIYAYLYFRSGKNKERAEDLTSEVFLKALEHFASFNPKTSSFGAWIYSIAHNHLVDHYRVNKVTVSLDDINEAQFAHHPNPGKQIDAVTEVRKVIRTIDTLPENYREILRLKYLNGLDNKEIEQKLGKTQSNIRVLIHRSVNELRKKLEMPQ